VNASNFFDLFGLNDRSSVSEEAKEAPKKFEEQKKDQDVLNMQLNAATGKLQVMSGSFSDILDCVTFYVNIDQNFLNEILFTHTYFCPTKALLNGFKAHFVNTQNVGKQASTAQEKKSATKVMEQVQERLSVMIETWIESHFYYFDENQELLNYFLLDFIPSVMLDEATIQSFHHLVDATVLIRNYHLSYRSMKSSVAKDEVLSQLLREDKSGLIMDRRKNLRVYKQAFVAVEVINLIMRKLKIQDRGVAISLLDTLREKGTIINVMKESAEFEDGDSLWQFKSTHRPPRRDDVETSEIKSILELNALTAAEQLTMIEFETFQKIVPMEVCHQAWSKNNGSKAPNVMKLINFFNTTTYWVASEVCNQPKLEQRVLVLSKMIEIAERCEQIHNFQTLMEILVGLSMGPVSRLTQTWEALPKEKMQSFQKLQKLIDNRKNYSNYRMVLEDAPLPCFPYVGLSLKDLTFIEDGNENFLDEEKEVINWQKMSMISKIFDSMQRFQQHPYDFEIKPFMKTWLLKGRVVVTEDNDLYDLSFACQPRKTATRE
jgi:hypothetical protein